jgi:hypothetical protein
MITALDLVAFAMIIAGSVTIGVIISKTLNHESSNN